MTAPAHTLAQNAALGWVIDDNPKAQRTLERMAGFCYAGVNNPAIVRYANEIIENTRPREYNAQIGAVNLFGTQYFRFLNNPIGVQRVRTPADMIADIESKGFCWGACDDAAVLMATLGMCNALNARFRAVAFGHTPDPSAPLTHVIADLFDGATWCPLDITKPQDLLRAPMIARTLTLEL